MILGASYSSAAKVRKARRILHTLMLDSESFLVKGILEQLEGNPSSPESISSTSGYTGDHI